MTMNLQPEASHFIDGRYREDTAGEAIPVIYPATGEVIATVHAATPAVVEEALASAARAQKEWAALRGVEAGAGAAARRRPDPGAKPRSVGAGNL
jgi:betaine-aldehyde dehydrogenase